MAMKHTKGDLIELFKRGQFDVIVQGCNCGCNMGDGIAKTIKQEFPEAYEADLATPKFSREKMGTYSQAEIWRLRDNPGWTGKVPLGTIINAYIQFHWRGAGPNNGPLCSYAAVTTVFRRLKNEFGGKGLRFGVPAIGCARAGGDWNIVSKIIDEELEGENVTFVEFNQFDPRGNFKKHMSSR